MPHTNMNARLLYGPFNFPIKICAGAREDELPLHIVYSTEAETMKAAAAGGGSKIVQFPSSEPSGEPPLPKHVARVHRKWVGEDDTPIPDDALFRAWYPQPNEPVVVRESAIDKLMALPSDRLVIRHLSYPHEIDDRFYNLSFDVWPAGGAEKVYELFYGGLKDNGYVGIGEVVMGRRERNVVIRPGRRGLVMYTLYSCKDIRSENEYPVTFGLATEPERRMTKRLMRADYKPFDPTSCTDKCHDRVLEYLIHEHEAAYPPTDPNGTPRWGAVLNIEERLRESLASKRKPPESERRKARPARKNPRRKK